MESTKITDLSGFREVRDNSDVYSSVRAELRVNGCTPRKNEKLCCILGDDGSRLVSGWHVGC